jgi:hypothetical protein
MIHSAARTDRIIRVRDWAVESNFFETPMTHRFPFKRAANLVVIWLVFAVVFAFVLGAIFRPPYDQLARDNVPTVGWITLKEPKNHQNVHYAFSADSQIHEGVGHGGEGGIPAFDELQIGQKVPVFYDSANPKLSSLGDPNQLLRKANLLTASGSILFSIFAVVALYWKGLL